MSLDAGRRAMTAVVALFLAAVVWVAIWVPFHATDALIYGRWPRLIGETGDLHFPGVGSGFLQRPLVYLGEGWLWHLFGFSEPLGRLWMALFAFVLVFAVWRLAALERGPLVGAIAAVLLVATPDVAMLAASGLTDVPVAAMVALCGAVAFAGPGATGPRFAALAVTAALACLAKPSGFFAIAGLGLALLVAPRGSWKRDWAALAVGGGLAVLYMVWQASELDVGIRHFMGGVDDELSQGVVSYYAELHEQSRASIVVGAGWLGPYVLLLMLFGLAYGVLRALAGWTHRRAATVAAPAAIVGTVLLPLAASGVNPGPFDLDKPAALLTTLLLLVPLWWSRDCPAEDAPSRAQLARMLIWAAVPTLAWIAAAPFQTRYLSPAWAPLFVLAAVATWTVVRGTLERSRGRALATGVVAVLCLMAVANLARNLDGLGARADGTIDATAAVRELGVTGWFDRERAARAADPDLAALREAVDAALADDPGRLITVDGRIAFWHPERVDRAEPQTCADVRDYGTLVVTQSSLGLDEEREERLSADELADATGGNAADPEFWARCPGLERIAERPGQFAVFRVGT